ncbi:hypothetical protein PENTCL1PPCAC_12771 [Pristionchus entomophagus]|uniref:G protein-coupled receptor n=1 Tax=Pristionchus entomophagus TaxID=358040 RepID=A0AAV5T4T1_9BILA|nr:hypothetical protein PENTCL1PPCAC_12771 [Pristionchus entomophagus]
MSSTIVTLLNEYPVLPLIQITVNTTLICIAVFLLRVLKRTQLHSNCRFLFTLWSFGFTLVFLCHALLGVVNLCNSDGYLPDNIIEPASRNCLYKVEMTVIFCTTCLEVMITTERVISSVNPERYHYRSRVAVEFLLPCLLLSLALAMLVGNASSGYCKKRDADIYGNCSLNARYQV